MNLTFFSGTDRECTFEILLPKGFGAHVQHFEEDPRRNVLVFTYSLPHRRGRKPASHAVELKVEGEDILVLPSTDGVQKLIFCEGVKVACGKIRKGISLLVWQNGPPQVQGVCVF